MWADRSEILTFHIVCGIVKLLRMESESEKSTPQLQPKRLNFSREEIASIRSCINSQPLLSGCITSVGTGVLLHLGLKRYPAIPNIIKIGFPVIIGASMYSAYKMSIIRKCVCKVKNLPDDYFKKNIVQINAWEPTSDNKETDKTELESESNWSGEIYADDGVPDLTELSQDEKVQTKPRTTYEELRKKYRQQNMSRTQQRVVANEPEEPIQHEPESEFEPKVAEQPKSTKKIWRNKYGDIIE